MNANRRQKKNLVETIKHTWSLGLTCFGGPSVHVLIFKRLFVEKLKWLDVQSYADIFALAGALPGPGSTKVLFSIALVRGGVLAGLLVFFMWSLPGACVMFGLSFGVARIPAILPVLAQALLTGLNAAAVGLIVQSAVQLSRSTTSDTLTKLILFATAAIGSCYTAVWLFPVLTVAGGLVTLVCYWPGWQPRIDRAKKRALRLGRKPDSGAISDENEDMAAAAAEEIELETPTRPDPTRLPTPPPEMNTTTDEIQEMPSSVSTMRNRSQTSGTVVSKDGSEASLRSIPPEIRFNIGVWPSIGLLVVFFSLLIAILVAQAVIPNPTRALKLFSNLLVAGTILFGGGPVVLPLLNGYTVTPGWVTSQEFLIGYSILQALPGPNFNFAAYIGALAVRGHSSPFVGALLGYVALFSPGILTNLAFFSLYSKVREHPIARNTLKGLNPAASGLVWTAVYRLWKVGLLNAHGSTSSLEASGYWAAIAGASFLSVEWFGISPPFSIIGGALAGLAYGGAVGSPGP